MMRIQPNAVMWATQFFWFGWISFKATLARSDAVFSGCGKVECVGLILNVAASQAQFVMLHCVSGNPYCGSCETELEAQSIMHKMPI